MILYIFFEYFFKNVSNDEIYNINIHLITVYNFIIGFNNCVRCQRNLGINDYVQCQFCHQKFHGTCITQQELSLISINKIFQCTECNLKLSQYFAYNYQNYQYGSIPNPHPMTIIPPQQVYTNNQAPVQQVKNNKKNKINLIKSKKQNKKNEEIIIDDDPEDNDNKINEIKNNNNNINAFSTAKNNNNMMMNDNMPQIINSFYYFNNNPNAINSQVQLLKDKDKNNYSNETSVNYNEELSNNNINNINSINNNSSMNIKKLKKVKPKKYNCIFNKNTLQILENMSITNEDKLLYILNNFKNIRIDPLILKVLEERKTKKRIGYYESLLSEEQNTSSNNEKEKARNELDNNYISQNNQNPQGIYSTPQQPQKLTFPIDDKILFSDLEKYNISDEILYRPLPKKIDLDYHMLNKLFIVWDFLITFKDVVFPDKIAEEINIDKNILVFYNELINEENDFEYYKNIYVSLLLICVKNIPLVIKAQKDQRLFVLKSILENLHSTSFNIIYDSPLIVLKEITECYIYCNSIEENNYQTLHEILKDVNDMKHRESYERNKNIYEKDEFHEDNLRSLDNNTRIFLLHVIIGLCFETVIIKEKIKSEYDNMAALSYQKKTLEDSMFEVEKRLKELNRMEDFTSLENDIANKEKRLEEIMKDELANNNLSEEEANVRKKEKEETANEINRMKNILNENEKLLEKKKEINGQINDTIEKIYNLKTLRKKYLGIDYQGNEYYYFITGEGVIYTKNRKREEWCYFDDKDDIQTLINKLTEKGKNEKKLKNILKFFLSQMKEKEEKALKEQELKEQEKVENSPESKEKDIPKEEEKQNINNTVPQKVLIDLGKKSPEPEKKKGNKSERKIYLRSGNKSRIQFSENDIQILESDSDVEIQENDEEKEDTNKNENKDSKEKNNNAPVPKKEMITFVLSEEHLPLNTILINIAQIFSDYLVQFNKQWESEENRNKWKEVLTNYATDKNILISLKMFNHKFKNPYKIITNEDEIIMKEKGNKYYYVDYFTFELEDGSEFKIPDTNLNLILSPKVKIWSKEMDQNDIDFYYNNDLLLSVFSREQLCYVVHFYEMAIFGLVHRREGKRKI